MQSVMLGAVGQVIQKIQLKISAYKNGVRQKEIEEKKMYIYGILCFCQKIGTEFMSS